MSSSGRRDDARHKLIRDPSRDAEPDPAAPASGRPAAPPPSPVSPEAAAEDHRSGMQRLAEEWRATRKQGTTIGPSVILEGEIRGSSDLEVDGTVSGRIELPDHDVTVGPQARVRADVIAARVVINGPIEGSVQARQRIELLPEARVTGTVMAPSVVVHEGAVLDGRVEMKPVAEQGASAPAQSPLPEPRTEALRVRPPSAPAGSRSAG